MKRTSALTGLAVLSAPLAVGAQSGGGEPGLAPPVVQETALQLEDGTQLRYAVSLPADFEASPDIPRPLVLALHPGGRDVYYGSWFMQSTVEPALRSWGAVMVAPDVPDRSWTTQRSEEAIGQLLAHVFDTYSIDRSRVLITGFSMGGRGTWHNAARRPDLFTAAIVMAGSPEGVDLEALATTPLYLIHSPDDEVVPFAPVEAAFHDLAERGHSVRFQALPGASHYQMGSYVEALAEAGAWVAEAWLGSGRTLAEGPTARCSRPRRRG